MTGDETDKVLGRPEISILYGCRQAGSLSVYLRTDWLGGEEKWTVDFDRDDRVRTVSRKYHPFAVQPPWLGRTTRSPRTGRQIAGPQGKSCQPPPKSGKDLKSGKALQSVIWAFTRQREAEVPRTMFLHSPGRAKMR